MASRSGYPVFELLLVFVGIFLLQIVAGIAQSVTAVAGLVGGLFVLAPPITENPWTIVTSVYAHGSIQHLLSNSVALIIFGWPIARATTRLRFHVFFLLSGSLAGITQVLTTVFLAELPIIAAEPTAVIGASGGVFALGGYLLASNRLSDSLSNAITVPRWLTITMFVVIAAVLTIATGSPGVALFAHFAGLLFGLLTGSVGLLAVPGRHPQTHPRQI